MMTAAAAGQKIKRQKWQMLWCRRPRLNVPVLRSPILVWMLVRIPRALNMLQAGPAMDGTGTMTSTQAPIGIGLVTTIGKMQVRAAGLLAHPVGNTEPHGLKKGRGNPKEKATKERFKKVKERKENSSRKGGRAKMLDRASCSGYVNQRPSPYRRVSSTHHGPI